MLKHTVHIITGHDCALPKVPIAPGEVMHFRNYISTTSSHHISFTIFVFFNFFPQTNSRRN